MDVSIGGSLANVVQQASVAIGTPVTYNVVFQNEWTAARHPTTYPDDAHWSPAMTAVHNENYQMWTGGEKASTGVKNVAETGSTSALQSELNSAGEDVSATDRGPLLFPKDGKPKTQTFDFDIGMDSDHPLISTVTMIADSPDWFAGFHDLMPVDENGYWYESFVVESDPYDSGTDAGTDYLSANKAQAPVDIFKITGYPFENNGQVLPVATWTFTLIEPEITSTCTDVEGGDVPVNDDGSKTKSCGRIGRKQKLNARVCMPGKPAWEMCPVAFGNDCTCKDTDKKIPINGSGTRKKKCSFLNKKGKEDIKERLCEEGEVAYTQCPVTCGRTSCA